MEDLILLIKTLRQKCPWDKKQTLSSMKNNLIEETYELVEAIESNNIDAMKEEIGDIIFLGIFFALLLEDEQKITFDELIITIIEKYRSKHPHVFRDKDLKDQEAVLEYWHKSKKDLFKGISKELPALLAAKIIQERVQRVGFDWDSPQGPLDKVKEELEEVEESLVRDDLVEEFGDLLFACVNLARHLSCDPEDALRSANKKFVERFRKVERELRSQGKSLEDVTLQEMDAVWDKIKQRNDPSRK